MRALRVIRIPARAMSQSRVEKAFFAVVEFDKTGALPSYVLTGSGFRPIDLSVREDRDVLQFDEPTAHGVAIGYEVAWSDVKEKLGF